MTQKVFLLLAILLILPSCATKKIQPSTTKTPPLDNLSFLEELPEASYTFREVEERLLPSNNTPVINNNYFVIIGSFRFPLNAEQFQQQLLAKGFNSDIIATESGLNRVSVMSTNDIQSARGELLRIRKNYPEYYDVWLLIKKQ
jgi:cell division protein FtsN